MDDVHGVEVSLQKKEYMVRYFYQAFFYEMGMAGNPHFYSHSTLKMLYSLERAHFTERCILVSETKTGKVMHDLPGRCTFKLILDSLVLLMDTQM